LGAAPGTERQGAAAVAGEVEGVAGEDIGRKPDATGRLPLPETVNKYRIRWSYAGSILVLHVLALLAFVPALFTWTGFAAMLAGCYVFGTLGVNLCFHRLLTHRSFRCSKRTEYFLALLGVCCLQEGPGRWTAIHRKHHQESDERPDPHSPLVNFLWGHVGWLITENRATDTFHMYQRYARDLLSQPFYLNLERRLNWLWVYAAHVVIFAALGLGIGWAVEGDWKGAGLFAASFVLWGVVVRTVVVWHITWSVNSLSHLWGYKSHNTGENSRNNWFVALISNGEGWHNNHHADQRSAAHGHKWWELDVTYLTIRAMEVVGLASHVMRHDRHSHPHPHPHAGQGEGGLVPVVTVGPGAAAPRREALGGVADDAGSLDRS
jgi:stearoyl-CoA desaturase (delta-9 desaturase)